MPLHPRFVHFPIALLAAGILLLVTSMHPRGRSWERWGWANVLLGWLSMLPAIFTGLVDQPRAPQEPAVQALINQHITAALATWAVFGYALYEYLRQRDILHTRKRWRVILALVLGATLLVITGELGGQLVYQWGVGTR